MNETFYYVSSTGSVEEACNDNTCFSVGLRENSNYFETREAAERAQMAQEKAFKHARKCEQISAILKPYACQADVDYCDTTEVFTINIECIEEGREFETLDHLNTLLESCGFRLIADDAGSKIGCIWTMFD